MEDRQINKWLRRRFATVGWTLLLYHLLLNVLVIATMAADVAGQYLKAFGNGRFPEVPDTDALMGNAWGYILTIAVGLVILHAWKGGDYWKAEILKKEAPMKPGPFFAMLVLVAGSQMVSSLWIALLEVILNQFGRSATEILESVSGDSDTFSMFLYASVLAPVSEEILFRGFVLRSLRPFGKRFAIFGSAFLFAVFHGNLLQAPYAFLAGLVLGYAAAEYSITWAVVLHMFNNLVLADLMTRALEALPVMAADIISWVVFGGFALTAVVILIGEREEIKAYRANEWMDRRCLKWFFFNAGMIVLMLVMAVNMVSMFAM